MMDDAGFLEGWIEKITVNPEVVKIFLLKLMPLIFDLVSVENGVNTMGISRDKRTLKREHDSIRNAKKIEYTHSRQGQFHRDFCTYF